MIVVLDSNRAFWPVKGSITIIKILSATLKGLASSFLIAFFIKSLNIGSAAFAPVSYLPKGLGLSDPTYTPIASFEVKPINHASVLLFVVPVFPAKSNLRSFNFFPVPLLTAPSNKEVIW